MKVDRWAIRFFRSRCIRRRPDPFRAQTRAFINARLLVRCYYVALLYFAFAFLPDWQAILMRTAFVPLWPVAWLKHADLRFGETLILSLYIGGTLLAAITPEKRWARALAFLGLFEFVALNNSFGKIGHSLHLWVLTAFLLIFLPAAGQRIELPSRAVRQSFLAIFWGCQALVLLVYSMAGLGKLLGAIYQISTGQPHAFMPHALALIVADRLIETNSQSLFGPWLIYHPMAGWPIMVGDIYLQFFSFWAAFRPSLHKLWAVALILFHLASFLFLTINFAQNVFLLALLFIASPFRPAGETWRQTLADLPLLGSLFVKLFPTLCAS
jgi:hypothetical protein